MTNDTEMPEPMPRPWRAVRQLGPANLWCVVADLDSPEDGQLEIAVDLRQSYAEQIVREHNAHDALVAALERQRGGNHVRVWDGREGGYCSACKDLWPCHELEQIDAALKLKKGDA